MVDAKIDRHADYCPRPAMFVYNPRALLSVRQTMRLIHSTSLLFAFAGCSSNQLAKTGAAALHDAPVIHDTAQPDAARDALTDASTANTAQVAMIEAGATVSVAAAVVDGGIYGLIARTDGPCTLYHEQLQQASLSAGTITVSGTTTGYTLTPSGTVPTVDYETSPTPTSPLFTTGATLSITAAGGDFPAFSGSVTAPAVLEGFTTPTTVSRAGYTATWTAGTGPKIWIFFFGASTSSEDIVICRVDDTGSFTVPSSTFSMLSATDTMFGLGIARVSETLLGTPDVSLIAMTQIAPPSSVKLTP
jgi:hypothetical protein